MVTLTIVLCSNCDTGLICAFLENADEIIAGYGDNPYDALRDLINELQYQHEYFRAENE